MTESLSGWHHKFRDLDVDEMVRLHVEKKLNVSKIATVFGCDRSTIQSRLELRGIRIRKRRGDIDLKEVERLYVNEKQTIAQIAKFYNCCAATISRRLNQIGVETNRNRTIYEMDEDYVLKRYIQDKVCIGDIYEELKLGVGLMEGEISPTGLSEKRIQEIVAGKTTIRRENARCRDIKPGDRFGTRVVKERIKNRDGNTRYSVECDCGHTSDTYGAELEKSKTCTECKTPPGERHPNWKGCGDIPGSYWSSLKDGATLRDLKFDIDIEYAWDLFLKQDRRCSLTGLPLVFQRMVNKKIHKQTASLDRVDSRVHYKEGNVQWVHKRVNLMKWAMPQRHFVILCKLVAENDDSMPIDISRRQLS